MASKKGSGERRLPAPPAPSLVSPGRHRREGARWTHHVGQRGGLGLSSLAVVSLSVAWCKEVAADTGRGKEKKKRKGKITVRCFFRPVFLLPRYVRRSARCSSF